MTINQNPNLRECEKAFGLSGEYVKEDITRTYRKLALKSHPDQGGDSETFTRITVMRDILIESLENKNSNSYHRFTKNKSTGRGDSAFHFDFDNFNFDDFLHGFGGQRRYGRNNTNDEYTVKNRPKIIRQDLDLDMIIITSPVEREITVTDEVWCTACYGRGSLNVRDRKNCDHCKGIGIESSSGGAKTCSRCHGHGFVYTNPCPICHGAGKEKINRKGLLKLNPLTIPDKISLGDNVFYKLDISEKSKNGEWYRDGFELHRLLMVNVFDLVLQSPIEWRDLLSSKRYEITFKEPYAEGTKMRLPNMGLSNGINRGDLILHLKGIYPEASTIHPQLIQAIKEFRNK